MITAGGELNFVKQMFEESISVKENVTWFTSLLGKRNDFNYILDYLDSIDLNLIIKKYEFTCGKTTRFIVAWSFQEAVTKD
jgi:23S rRNA A1618 N6-methylase RlmF